MVSMFAVAMVNIWYDAPSNYTVWRHADPQSAIDWLCKSEGKYWERPSAVHVYRLDALLIKCALNPGSFPDHKNWCISIQYTNILNSN